MSRTLLERYSKTSGTVTILIRTSQLVNMTHTSSPKSECFKISKIETTYLNFYKLGISPGSLCFSPQVDPLSPCGSTNWGGGRSFVLLNRALPSTGSKEILSLAFERSYSRKTVCIRSLV